MQIVIFRDDFPICVASFSCPTNCATRMSCFDVVPLRLHWQRLDAGGEGNSSRGHCGSGSADSGRKCCSRTDSQRLEGMRFVFRGLGVRITSSTFRPCLWQLRSGGVAPEMSDRFEKVEFSRLVNAESETRRMTTTRYTKWKRHSFTLAPCAARNAKYSRTVF